MREFYSQSSSSPLLSLSSGQLVAVRAEEEEEILRAQVCEVMADKVKVRSQGNAQCEGQVMDPRGVSEGFGPCLLQPIGSLCGSWLLRGHQQNQSV